MARSLLREEQIRDEDNMSEAEHDSWTHVDLVTSGTISLQSDSGDYYGTLGWEGDQLRLTNLDHGGSVILVAENSSGDKKTLLSGDPDGVTSMAYQGISKIATFSEGARIYGGYCRVVGIDSQYTDIRHVGDDSTIYNTSHGGHVLLRSETTAGAAATLIDLDPDGAAELYYAGDKTLETTSTSGINVINEVTAVTYYGDGSNLTGIASGLQNIVEDLTPELGGDLDTGVFTISGTGDIYCNDLYASEATIHVGDGQIKSTAGSIELYNDGVKALETDSTGINIYRDSYSMSMGFDGSGSMIIDNDNGNNITLQANGKNLFSAWDNGVTTLYYAGETRLATYTQGIIIHRDSNTCRITQDASGGMVLQQDVPGRFVIIRSQDAADTGAYRLFYGEGDGPVELYYSGEQVFETTDTGFTVTTSGGDTILETRPGGITIHDDVDNSSIYQSSGTLVIDNATGDTVNITNDSALCVQFDGPNSRTVFRNPGDNSSLLTFTSATGLMYPTKYYFGENLGNDGRLQLTTAAEEIWFTASEESQTMGMRGYNVSTSQKTMVLADPDGAVSLYYMGEKTVETVVSGIKINSGGEVRSDGTNIELYHDGDKVLETITDGIKFFDDGGGTSLSIYQEVDSSVIENNTNGGWIYFKGTTTAGSSTNMITADPDSEVRLYHPGTNTLIFKSQSKGVLVGSSQNISILSESGYASIIANTHGDHIRLTAEDTEGTPRVLFNADPDGAAELYHAGNKTFETVVSGIKINSGGEVRSDGTNIELYHDGNKVLETWDDADEDGILFGRNLTSVLKTEHTDGDIHLANTRELGEIFLDVTVAGPSLVTGLAVTAVGGVFLYYGGTSKLETRSDGAIVRSGGKLYFQGTDHTTLQQNGNIFQVINTSHGGTVEIIAENSEGDLKDIFIGDPDGAAELYHTGEKQLETVVSGVEIPVDNFMYFGDTTTSGSWRMGVSGEDFIHQKYDGADWATKQTVVG